MAGEISGGNFDLTIENFDETNTETTQFRLLRDPDSGNLMYSSRLAPPIRTGLSQGALTVADVPPEQEMTFGQTTWHKGMGEFEIIGTESQRSWYTLGVDTRYANQFTLAPAKATVAATDVLDSVSGFRVISANGGAFLVAVTNSVGSYRVHRSTDGVTWTALGSGTETGVPTDMIEFNGDLYIALGRGTAFDVSTNWTGTAGSVTFAAGSNSPPEAEIFGLLNDRLVIAGSPSGGTTQEVFFLNEAGDATDGNDYDTGTPVGRQDVNHDFKGLVQWGDTLIIGKEDGIFQFKADGEPEPMLENDFLNNNSTGRLVTVRDVLFASIGRQGFYKNDRSGWDDISVLKIPQISTTSGAPTKHPTTDSTFAYAVIHNTTDGFILVAHHPDGSIHMLNSASVGDSNGVLNAQFVVANSQGFLFFGTGSNVLRVFRLSLEGRTVDGDTRIDSDITFESEGFLGTGWIDYGYPNLAKTALRINLSVNVPASTTVDVFYQINGEFAPDLDGSTGWTQVGAQITSATATHKGIDDLYNLSHTTLTTPNTEPIYRIRYKIKLGTTSSDVTPVVRSFTAFAEPNLAHRQVITASVAVADAVSQHSGNPQYPGVEVIKTAIKNMVLATTPLQLTEPDGGTIRCRLADWSHQLKKIRRSTIGPDNEEWIYNLTFQEVKYD